MPSVVRQFWTLARLTTLEITRQPFCLLLTVGGLLFIALLPLLRIHTFGHGEKLVRDSALAVHLGTVLILGGTAACTALRPASRRGTTVAVLSKPVGRTVYFLAQYAGVCLVLIPVSASATLATLLSVRTVDEPFMLDPRSGLATPLALATAFVVAGALNYALRKPFASTGFRCILLAVAAGFMATAGVGPEGQSIPFGAGLNRGLVPVSILVLLAALVFASVSMTLATQLDTTATLTAGAGVLCLGLFSEYWFGRAASDSLLAAIGYAALPNWQHFWAADMLSYRQPVRLHDLAGPAHYAAAYAGAVLCLGVASFRHREIRA